MGENKNFNLPTDWAWTNGISGWTVLADLSTILPIASPRSMSVTVAVLAFTRMLGL